MGEFAEKGELETVVNFEIKELKKISDYYKNLNAVKLREAALEEVVAEACQRMLTDSNALERLAELKKKDSGLFHKIKSFIANFFNRVVQRYKNLTPQGLEAKLVDEIPNMSERMKVLFSAALVAAAENRRIAGNIESNDVAKFQKTRYNEFNTLAMQWRYNTATKVGDTKIIHKNLNTAVLIKATEDGYIKIISGKYSEVAQFYERAYREATDPFYEHFNSYGTDKGRGDWDSFDDENRGVGDSGAGSSASKGVQNITPGNYEHNWRSDREISGAEENSIISIYTKFQYKPLDALSDTELLARHLEENSEAVGEILRRTADIEMNPRMLNLLVNKTLKEYGISKEGREQVASVVPLLLDAAKLENVKGRLWHFKNKRGCKKTV